MAGRIEYSKQIQIGEDVYLVQHPDPEKAFEIGIQLTKIIGEPFAAMADAAAKDNLGAVLQGAIRTLLDKVDAKATLGILKELFRYVEIQTPGASRQILSVAFAEHFKGRPGHILRVGAEVIAFQFEDFFAAIRGAIASAMTKEGEAA